MTMFTKLTLAFALLFSVSILAAAQPRDGHELRTGIPYYIAPFHWAYGGGVAPARVGNEECPSSVKLTHEVDRGVPITFSIPNSDGESVVIKEKITNVSISFDADIDCHRNTWANLFYISPPDRIAIELVGKAVPRIYEITRFSLERHGLFYRLYASKEQGGIVVNYNVVFHHEAGNDFNSLALSKEDRPLFFAILPANDYYRTIKSVV